jgi:hypothetical protein
MKTIVPPSRNWPPIDAEFKAARSTERIFTAAGLLSGRCFGSKSGYCNSNPGNRFFSNANVFCRTKRKLWWGDLDLAKDKKALLAVARRLRTRLYILSEFDGRFKNADIPHSEVVTRAIWHTGYGLRLSPREKQFKTAMRARNREAGRMRNNASEIRDS